MADQSNAPIETYSVIEAGIRLGLGRDAAYEAARRGDIPALKIGRFWRVPKAAFDRMLETGRQPVVA